ncbi:hypothetical protein F511_27133 [Dorcoceras hygrometricum]|uniref:Uncharacterized protein n=1 Tax=Dorcoceras hygrometricum TaxID=472368 RepID=A0A2Z7C2W9_9LAMI|nr:hypothetical protein F511_27133 [Dorcoceras hygrometricum]
MAGDPPVGPPPGPANSIGTNHGPNRELQCTHEGREEGCPPTHDAVRVVDWAVKMRIRPPELETSICDVKASRLPPSPLLTAAAPLAPPPAVAHRRLSSSSDLFRPSRRGDSVREIFVAFSIADRRRNRDFSRGPDWENDDRLPLKCRFPREIGRSQEPRRQQGINLKHPMDVLLLYSLCIDRSRCKILKSSAAPRERDPDPPLRQQMHRAFSTSSHGFGRSIHPHII